MRRDTVPSRTRGLPRFIVPCPACGGQMIVAAVEPSPLDRGCKDITHRCSGCGCTVTQMIAPPGRDRRTSDSLA